MTEVCNRPIWLHERQLGKGEKCKLAKNDLKNVTEYKRMKELKDSGRIFSSNDEAFQYIDTLMSRNETNILGERMSNKLNYIYVISKEIAGNTYIKVGKSEKPNLSRITGAQTFLIPGLNKDAGFLVHYFYFYKNEIIGTTDDPINHHIEQRLHFILRNYFKASNIRFGTDIPSEWYMVPKDDIIFFCGFIFDIISLFSHNSEHSAYKLSPKYIWKFSNNNPPLLQVKIASKDKTLNRLKKDKRYNKILEILENMGLREAPSFDEGTIQIEEMELGVEKSKGSKEYFQREFFKEGVIVDKTDTNEYGRILHFPKDSNNKYIITSIKKNTLKFGLGQPLKSGGIYGVIKRWESETDEMNLSKFQKENIFIIPGEYDVALNTFKNYYIEIGDLLTLIKPDNEEDFEKWPLKNNYEHYQTKQTKTISVQRFRLSDNREIPTWFFKKSVQERFAKQFINNKKKYEHEDYSVLKDDNKKYRWSLSGQFIYKESDSKDGRNVIFIVREGHPINCRPSRSSNSTNETKITEEVPIVRILLLFNLTMEDLKYSLNKNISSVTVNNTNLQLKDNIRVSRSTIFQIVDEDENINDNVVTFYIDSIFSQTSGIDGEKQQIFLKGIVKFPIEDSFDKKKFTIDLEYLGKDSRFQKMIYPLYKKNTIFKLKPNKLKDFGELQTPPDKFHYAKIKDIVIEDDYYYVVQYFSPWDKIRNWPIPRGNVDEIEKGEHSKPNTLHTEQYSANTIDKNANVVKENDSEFLKYLEELTTYHLSVVEIIGHAPKSTKNIRDFLKTPKPKYKVLFENRSKGFLIQKDFEIIKENLIENYWNSLKKSKTKKNEKKGGKFLSKRKTFRKNVQRDSSPKTS